MFLEGFEKLEDSDGRQDSEVFFQPTYRRELVDSSSYAAFPRFD